MRYWYVNKKREKVFRTRSLVLMACVIVIIMMAVQPRATVFRQMLGGLQADTVALNYARVLAALDPEDAGLQALLAQQYANLGRLADADAVLRKLTDGTPADSQHVLLHLSVLQQRLYASTIVGQRRDLTRRVVRLLDVLDAKGLSEADIETVAVVALAFEQPNTAAQLYTRLFLNSLEPQWALKAGSAFEAAEQPLFAARAYASASNLPGDHGEHAAQQALRLYLAAASYSEGIDFLTGQKAKLLSPGLQEHAVYFALAANAPDLAGHFARQLAQSSAGTERRTAAERAVPLGDLINAALAVNDLKTAEYWARQALTDTPDAPEPRKMLAQVLEWQGEVDGALEQWLWLAENATEIAETERTWLLAKSVYRADTAAAILNARARTESLAPAEMRAWMETNLATGELSSTIARLQRYLQDHPADEEAWRTGAHLLDENEQLDDAIAWWQDIAARFPLSTRDKQTIAAIHWRMYDLPAALAALRSVDEAIVQYDAAYWRSVGELAYETSDRRLANDAYTRLAAFDQLDADEYDKLLETLTEPGGNDARYHANRAWENTGEPRFLLLAMRFEFDSDEARFERLLTAADDIAHRLSDNALYWTLKGRHLARQQFPERALKSLSRALALAPNYAPAVASYASLLVEQRKLTELWQLLDRRHMLPDKHPELFQPFATGYMALGRYKEAAYWLRKAVAKAPDDGYLVLDLAEALTRTGRADEALQWKTRALKKALAAEDGATPMHLSALRNLSAGLLSRAHFERLFENKTSHDRFSRVQVLIHDLLDSGQWEAARSWIAYAKSQGIELDDYPKFMMAHQGRSLKALSPFTEHASQTVKAEALLASRQDSKALITALNEINTRTPESDRHMLTRIATDISINRPSGVRAAHESQDFGSLKDRSTRADVSRTFDELTTSVSLRQQDSELSPALTRSARRTVLSERTATVRTGGKTDSLQWEAELGATQSDVKDLFSAALTVKKLWDQDHSSFLRGAYGQIADESPLLSLFARKDSLTLGSTWRPSARNTLSLRVSGEDLSDRMTEPISRGFNMEAGWQHAVFFERPAVFARASVTSARRQLKSPTALLFRNLSDDALRQLLPERTDRLGIGLTIAHGEPGRMNWRTPSPRYRVDMDVGYQWPDKQPTYEISASIGSRVFGDDELALTAALASRPDLGWDGSALSFGLTYNYRLGR